MARSLLMRESHDPARRKEKWKKRLIEFSNFSMNNRLDARREKTDSGLGTGDGMNDNNSIDILIELHRARSEESPLGAYQEDAGRFAGLKPRLLRDNQRGTAKSQPT